MHYTGDAVNMIGRSLQGSNDIYASDDYNTPIFEDYGLQKANIANAPGVSSLRLDDSADLLSSEYHAKCRRTVGTLQWQSPIPPDKSYATRI